MEGYSAVKPGLLEDNNALKRRKWNAACFLHPHLGETKPGPFGFFTL